MYACGLSGSILIASSLLIQLVYLKDIHANLFRETMGSATRKGSVKMSQLQLGLSNISED
jgi:hypothetical protein